MVDVHTPSAPSDRPGAAEAHEQPQVAVLVADPDPSQAQLLRARWDGTPTRVLWCADNARALFLAGRHTPDLVVLTLTHTDTSADQVTQVLREHSDAPIMLALGEGDTTWATQILGRALLAGANEIIATTYASDPAFAKLHTVVTKLLQSRHPAPRLTLGSLTLLPGRLEVRLGERTLTPTVREFEILHYLVRNQHRTVVAHEVIDAVWREQPATPQTLSVHLARLRKILAPEIQIPHIRGAGYRITLSSKSPETT